MIMNPMNVTTERVQLLKDRIDAVLQFCKERGFPLQTIITEGQSKQDDPSSGPQLLDLAEDIERIAGIEDEHEQFMALHDQATRIERTLAEVLILQYRQLHLERQYCGIRDIPVLLREMAMLCGQNEKSLWGRYFFGIDGDVQRVGYVKKFQDAAAKLGDQFQTELNETCDDPYLHARVWARAERTSDIVRGHIRQACIKLITGGPDE